MDFDESWGQVFPLLEFAYNNSYHTSIGMVPFEGFHGRKCRSPLQWEDICERRIIGPELVQQTVEIIKIIIERMKIAQDRQKSYADMRRNDLLFRIGDKVFQRISSFNGIMRFRKKGKLAPRYIGPFEILQSLGERSYMLALLPQLSRIHNVFHVSMLRKYLPSSDHVLRSKTVDMQSNLTYEEQPRKILE